MLHITQDVTAAVLCWSLRQHMEQHRASCPQPVADFSQEVDLLLGRLALRLEDRYKDDIEVEKNPSPDPLP